MVDLQILTKKQIHEMSRCREVSCLGAGKMFVKFMNEYSDIAIKAVADNYSDKSKVNGVPVKRIKEYSQEINRKDALFIITCMAFEEIITQLDEIEQLDGILCCLMPDLREVFEQRYNEFVFERTNSKQLMKEQETDGKHFQIWEMMPYAEHAGGKAPADVRSILRNIGYKPFNVHISSVDEKTDISSWMYRRSKEEWTKVEESIPHGSTIVLQHPLQTDNIECTKCLYRLKEKGVCFISIVHDIEQIRKIIFTAYNDREQKLMLEIADVLIVHSDEMKTYFVEKGFPEKRIVVMEIFDYLVKAPKRSEPKLKKTLLFAGSLEERKSGFLKDIHQIYPVEIDLYGPDYDEDMFRKNKEHNNTHYKGSFPADIVPNELNNGFGLVWDGNSIDTCSGPTGEYLKTISSHKLSLYIVSGVPVIIWNKAAAAAFVKNNDIGITVESLREVPEILRNITEHRYAEMVSNTRKIAERLTKGYYLRKAIKEAGDVLASF